MSAGRFLTIHLLDHQDISKNDHATLCVIILVQWFTNDKLSRQSTTLMSTAREEKSKDQGDSVHECLPNSR